MTRSTHKKGAAFFAATLTLGLAPALAPGQAQAASTPSVQFNNLSVTTALNTNPNSSTDVDDSKPDIHNGDRLYLGSHSDPSALTGWITGSDGKKKAFTSSDYTLTKKSSHTYTLSFKGASLKIDVSQSANVATMYLRTSHGDLEKDLVKNVEAKKGNEDVGGSMALVAPDGSTIYNGALTSFKGRGNATWGYKKKPYQIKLDKSTELVAGAGKSKTWVLLANYVDATGLRNEVSYNLESAVLQRAGATDFSIKGRLVDLNIDGDYRGTYYLSEKVQVDKSRIDITDTDKANEDANPTVEDLDALTTKKVTNDSRFPGIKEAQFVNLPMNPPKYQNSGYVLQMEFAARARTERSYFISRNGTPFVMQTPENASADELSYASGVFQDFENALYAKDGKNAKGKTWQSYIDVDSFARFYALEEFFGNQDAFASSTYFYMNAGGKIVASPVWDDDRGLGDTTALGSKSTGIFVAKGSRLLPQWIKQLSAKTEFRHAVASAYTGQVAPAVSDVLSSKLTTWADEAKHSIAMNRLKWGAIPAGVGTYYDTKSASGDVQRLRDFMSQRNTYLSSALTSSGYVKSAALPDGVYTISNGKLVADIASGSTADKANARLYTSNGSDAQRFRITRGDDGFYTVINVKSGKALEVAGSSTADGANVDQYAPNGTRAQKWFISSFDGKNYSLVTAVDFPAISIDTWKQHWNGRVLTATKNGTSSGTNLEVNKDTGASGQTFGFSTTTPSGPSTPTQPTTPTNGATAQVGKTYTISTGLDRSKVLDVKGSSTANGANIQIYTANGSKAQQFTLAAGPNGTFILKTGMGGVMDMANSGTKPGTNVWQYKANGSKAQEWILKPTGANDGSYFIVSSLSGLNVDVAGSSAANGANVQTYTANGTTAQKFYLNLK